MRAGEKEKFLVFPLENKRVSRSFIKGFLKTLILFFESISESYEPEV